MSNGTLYLIPVPIHEHTWQTVLPQCVSETIKNTRYFLVENIRTARRTIAAMSLGIAIDSLTFWEFTPENPMQALEAAIKTLRQGQNVGVMSEAGCPGVADPGALAVQKAHSLNIPVVPLVGPSSILLALMASGLNGQQFAFQGYVPINKPERAKSLQKMEQSAIATGQTQIFMDTPYRNDALLKDTVELCKPTTLLCVACELTAPHQFIKTLPVAQWRKMQISFHKKPALFLLGSF